jgi:hypothetical protein
LASACYIIKMRLFFKLALISTFACASAWAQQEGPPPGNDQPPPPEQYQQQPPPQYQQPPQEQYQQPPQQQPYPPGMDDEQAPPQAENEGPQYGYMGPHPIPYDVGSGFCYQQGAHFHDYAPFDQYLFREAGGWFYFVGDPADFGYSQPMWSYRGHHPIPLSYGGGYCFIDWPHRHHYAPPVGVMYNNVGGYYVYGGPWDPWYWHYRPYYARYYGGYYRTNYYGGVYWRVRPAPMYRATVRVGAPGVYRAGVVAVAPGGARVYVGPPRPGFHGAVPAQPYHGGAGQPLRPATPVHAGGAPAGNPWHPNAAQPYHSAPSQGYHPAPAQQYHPAPAQQYHPAPAQQYHPAPAQQYHPAPAPAYHPAPAPAYHPAPAPAYHPAPSRAPSSSSHHR